MDLGPVVGDGERSGEGLHGFGEISVRGIGEAEMVPDVGVALIQFSGFDERGNGIAVVSGFCKRKPLAVPGVMGLRRKLDGLGETFGRFRMLVEFRIRPALLVPRFVDIRVDVDLFMV